MIPCGQRIPNVEHAVSMSLPTLEDVIGYEERSEPVMASICSGYPRFVNHWMVNRVQHLLRERYAPDALVLPLHDKAACLRLMQFLRQDLACIDDLPFGALILPDDCPRPLLRDALTFLQHTGMMLSSRQAEDYLVQQGVVEKASVEQVYEGDAPVDVVRSCLAGLYGVSMDEVQLYPSGMNAFFSVFDCLNEIQHRRQRDIWIEVGWLYLDTTAILQKLAGDYVHFKVDALDQLEAYVRAHHKRIAGITTEVMTNPLVHTPDMWRLRSIAKTYDLPLIVDVSMGTPVNVDVLPYADVVIESLTKFASGKGDVMSGAVIANRSTSWGEQTYVGCKPGHLYDRDLRRLGHTIQGYSSRMQVVNQHTAILTDYFRKHRYVREVYWATQPCSFDAYQRVRKHPEANGGVISVVFEKPLKDVYNDLPLCKGPSFGTEFTLCMAYVYMAHYDLVSSVSGRKRLAAEGLDPELLRISVGMEPCDDLIRAFETALR